MGTPLNQFVRRVLSPNLVPKKLFTSPKSPLSSKTNLQVQKSKSSLATNLFFQQSPNRKDISENFLGVQPFYGSPSKYQSFKIKINSDLKDTKYQYLVVDTPERGDILKSGLGNKNVAVLGKGNFGTVVEATYKGRKVVIKIINLRSPSAQNELNALNLKHENVVETLKVVLEKDSNFGIIIMKNYPDSNNMHDVLHNEYISIPKITTLTWALNIAHGLQFCHQNNILHLDIKPKNILIGDDNICRICDFGNSLNLEKDLHFANMGTVGYTAPEIFKGNKPTEKSDIYSMGITFWQMDSRKLPYENINCREVIIYEVVKNDLRPKRVNYRSDFSKIYESCWSSVPNQRINLCMVIEEINKLL